MRAARLGLTSLTLILLTLALVWLADRPSPAPSDSAPLPPPISGNVLRLGLTPDRDIFAQHDAYKGLAAYLGRELHVQVQLRTAASYLTMLQDFQDHQVDAAFVGSFIAVLAMDRLHTDALLKTQYPDGTSTYSGIVVVPEASPIHTIDDLRGHSLAGVRATTAADLFPVSLIVDRGLLRATDPPTMLWVGTHDDVLREVLANRADAGTVKDLRLKAFERLHPEYHLRRLAESPRVPENSLLARADLPEQLRADLRSALLQMDRDPAGQEALAALGIQRFIPCPVEGYAPVYDMIEHLGSAWNELGVPGPPPRRAAATGPSH